MKRLDEINNILFGILFIIHCIYIYKIGFNHWIFLSGYAWFYVFLSYMSNKLKAKITFTKKMNIIQSFILLLMPLFMFIWLIIKREEIRQEIGHFSSNLLMLIFMVGTIIYLLRLINLVKSKEEIERK